MSENLSDCLTAQKMYWEILNPFINNIKIPSVPPLLINGKKVLNFFKRAELFNKFFVSQGSLVKDSITLPSFKLCANKSDKLSFSEDDVTELIKKLNPKEQHVWDSISIGMIKNCGKSVSYPLKLRL